MVIQYQKTSSCINSYPRVKVGSGILNNLINSLPVEVHYPFGDYRFLGPGTKLKERLEKGDQPFNPLDAAALEHDIAYEKFKDIKNRNIADKELEYKAWDRVKANDSSMGEKAAAYLTTNAMKVKRFLGMGLKSKGDEKNMKLRKNKKIKKRNISFIKMIKKQTGNIMKIKNKCSNIDDESLKLLAKKCITAIKLPNTMRNFKKKKPRIIPIPKYGGALPLIPILAGISSLGALAGGVNTIVQSVRKILDAKKQIFGGNNNENQKVQVGNGMFLAPFKKGYGLLLHSPQIYKKKKLNILNHLTWHNPLSNYDIFNLIEYYPPLKKIFAGVFSKDELKFLKSPAVKKLECGIVNLSNQNELGTHWVAYYKCKGPIAYYYDSFGNLQPPLEILSYLRNCQIFYNRNKEQDFNTVICGQLCICFLLNMMFKK